MNSKNFGYSTPSMLLIIFSLSVVLCSLSMVTHSLTVKMKTLKKDSENYTKAEKFAGQIFKDFQCIKDDKADFDNASNMMDFISKYSFISVKDVSTGINEKILSQEFISNEAVKNLLILNPQLITQYGWINTGLISEKDSNVLSGNSVTSKLPVLNIYKMDSDFLNVVLEANNIQNSRDKTEKLFQLMQKQECSRESVSKILNVSLNSKIMNYLGVKTCFWQINSVCDNYDILEILGAVQDSKEDGRIKKYILIERKIEKRIKSEKA